MKVIKTIREMKDIVAQYKRSGYTIGFVPTMGYLHEGHLSLVDEARQANDVVIMSIFVNPLQFGPNEDYDAYPRDFERDESLAMFHGVDIVFYPSTDEMYPESLSVTLHVERRVDVLCGAHRPGHFDGVVTVLTKLFHIVAPDRAYFGLKDAQQVAVVEGLVTDYHFPLEIVRVPIVRENDGLAKSSRNVRLSEQEREQAPHLYKSLQHGRALIDDGERDPKVIKNSIVRYLQTHVSGEVEYVDILQYPELERMSSLQGEGIIAIAVQFNDARLIDNILFNIEGGQRSCIGH